MTQEEIHTFNALYNNPEYGPDAAMEFYEGIKTALWARHRRATTETGYATEQKVGMIGGMLIADMSSLGNGVMGPVNMIGALTGNEYFTNPNSPAYVTNNYMQGVLSSGREYATDKLGGVGGFLYDATFSTIQSATTMLVGAGLGGGSGKLAQWTSLILMGNAAAENSLQQYMDMGVSPLDAVVLATIDGAIEIATEKAGVERIFKWLPDDKGLFLKLCKEAFSEMGEEGAGAIASDLVALLYRDVDGKTLWEREVDDLMRTENITA